MAEPIRILIAEDHALVRKGLVSLLLSRREIQVVGEAVDGNEAVHMANSCSPNLILMDLEMPRKDGISAIKTIKRQAPECKILVITSYTDDERVIAAIRAGADGYMLKTMAPDDLIRAIHDVMQGNRPLDPAITKSIISELERPVKEEGLWPDDLTEREVDVIKLIAKGYSSQRIAEELMISDRTVTTHVGRILAKLKLENRTQIALYALREGLANLDGG